MKGIGILLILISCSGLGFQMAWLYRKRINQCRQIERCLQTLAGEIRFRQLPLTEALRLAGREEKGDCKDDFSLFLVRLAARLDTCEGGSFCELWMEELEKYLSKSLLKEEAELLTDLGQQLGNLDLEAQLTALRRFLEQWGDWIDALRKQEEKKGRLYRYLGVSAGFFLAILLI